MPMPACSASTARRAALEGVVAVWTLGDLPELQTASVPPLVPEPRGRPHRHPPLAGERVRHAGEAVAVVVADDPYRLADAVDRVIVEYEPLPVADDSGRRTRAVGPSRPRRLAGQCPVRDPRRARATSGRASPRRT